jgi:DnaJ family protein A protein 2
MAHGEKIVFSGLGDDLPPPAQPFAPQQQQQPSPPQLPTAGNLNIIIKEQDHAVFKRKGADLLIRKTLTLNEALTGFSFVITHLDQRKVVVKSKPGEIISPLGPPGGKGSVKMIPNEGMPSRGNPFVRGNLYVHFTVQFPTDGELSHDVITTLRQLLPGRPPEEENAHENVGEEATAAAAAEVVHTTNTDIRNFGKGGMAYSDSTTTSDSDESIPEGVQCQQS